MMSLNELPDGSHSVSDIEDSIEYTIKNMKHFPPVVLLIFSSIGLLAD